MGIARDDRLNAQVHSGRSRHNSSPAALRCRFNRSIGSCRTAGHGWKHQSAAPAVHAILTAGLPSRGMNRSCYRTVVSGNGTGSTPVRCTGLINGRQPHAHCRLNPARSFAQLGPAPAQLQLSQKVCFYTRVSSHNVALGGDRQTPPISFQEESVYLTVDKNQRKQHDLYRDW